MLFKAPESVGNYSSNNENIPVPPKFTDPCVVHTALAFHRLQVKSSFIEVSSWGRISVPPTTK